MEALELFTKYDEHKESFQWIFDTYFEEDIWNSLEQARAQESADLLLYILQTVWQLLPKDIFNVENNPSGWNELFTLVSE